MTDEWEISFIGRTVSGLHITVIRSPDEKIPAGVPRAAKETGLVLHMVHTR